jgi:hypothetical protein
VEWRTALLPTAVAAQDGGTVLRLGTNAADIANLDPHMASGTQTGPSWTWSSMA